MQAAPSLSHGVLPVPLEAARASAVLRLSGLLSARPEADHHDDEARAGPEPTDPPGPPRRSLGL